MKGEIVPSQHHCFKCGKLLYRCLPSVNGWEYYCVECRHLTMPATELQRQIESITDDMVGIVAAVPCTLRLNWTPAPKEDVQSGK